MSIIIPHRRIKEIDRTSGREATDAEYRWEWKPITAACLKWTILGGKENLIMAACLKWLNCGKEH